MFKNLSKTTNIEGLVGLVAQAVSPRQLEDSLAEMGCLCNKTAHSCFSENHSYANNLKILLTSVYHRGRI